MNILKFPFGHSVFSLCSQLIALPFPSQLLRWCLWVYRLICGLPPECGSGFRHLWVQDQSSAGCRSWVGSRLGLPKALLSEGKDVLGKSVCLSETLQLKKRECAWKTRTILFMKCKIDQSASDLGKGNFQSHVWLIRLNLKPFCLSVLKKPSLFPKKGTTSIWQLLFGFGTYVFLMLRSKWWHDIKKSFFSFFWYV